MSASPPPPPRTVVMLTGPTGVGKTALSVALAERFDIELISADSMQVYRAMGVGTAQPSAEERRHARFHLCGVVEPDDAAFNVQRFLDLCDAAHRDVLARGRAPLYVGGTGLYLRALRWGLFGEAPRDDAVRARLEAEADALGDEALHARLHVVDPAAAARIAPADRVRVVRALEVYEVSGQPLSRLQSQWTHPRARFRHVLIVLDAPRDLLRRRIAARTDAMLEAGWIEETAALLARGLTTQSHAFKALGYREIARHLAGEIGRDELRERIVTRTAQFARRQMTWFRRERHALWLDAPEGDSMALLGRLEEVLMRLGTPPKRG